VSAATLRRAHAVHPITTLQTEYSLWTRNPEVAGLQACRELGVAFVAFSPLARRFLIGKLRDVTTLDGKDIRRAMPRFSPDNYAANLRLLTGFEALAAEAGRTPSQLSLAWLLPDGTTLLKFRRLLETHKLGEALFAKVGEVLQTRGLKVGTGTIVDATIIGAPSSTKNATRSFVVLGLANIYLARQRLMA
jgi:hypothetical protein